ncbi:hypothetical protein FHR24_000616 [Wenyingzhuangia heitensis]|uniref:Lipoprotein n=1 Tax=Wenyingzhuangia heitensis TaxID=1487859 RepID=A0ABX0UAU3_9FLAO|nr:hypothetical protein [Wenyingzhuangia heitensis]NIJ44177.1 hypothetical protein [Wenyingzhuangia heitensis]
MKYILRISLVFILGLSSCIMEHDNEPECGDKNGRIRDECAKVSSDIDSYKTDSETYETIKLVFVLGTGTYDLLLTDTDELIKKNIYKSNATLRFSGFESQTSLTIYISKVDRTNGRVISGNFEFKGTYAENFQSTPIEINGEFNNVNF